MGEFEPNDEFERLADSVRSSGNWDPSAKPSVEDQQAILAEVQMRQLLELQHSPYNTYDRLVAAFHGDDPDKRLEIHLYQSRTDVEGERKLYYGLSKTTYGEKTTHSRGVNIDIGVVDVNGKLTPSIGFSKGELGLAISHMDELLYLKETGVLPSFSEYSGLISDPRKGITIMPKEKAQQIVGKHAVKNNRTFEPDLLGVSTVAPESVVHVHGQQEKKPGRELNRV